MKREIDLGSWYFRFSAEDFVKTAQQRYPHHTVEIREVLHPHTNSRRPTYHVILIIEEADQL